MGESWNKKDREKKKQKAKMDKADKMKERKENAKKGKSLDEMMAYVDENGNISSTPPDPGKKVEIKLEDIRIGVPENIPLTQEELTRQGKITFFNYEKGFGFIKDQQSHQSIFVHSNNLAGEVKENDKVSFQIEIGQRGPFAVNVKILD
ncbi:MAG: cold shock domain-containing protein [Chitinophagaceae bacterium]|jgi:cold shock CspA family protein|nr:cold shock domain-containing protein [Chitinophagaceae bacterium]OQY96583.1 MAG: DNA-binding protein [Sphingobacteriales bacterium UTBCD1]